jgi:hypothetical protein
MYLDKNCISDSIHGVEMCQISPPMKSIHMHRT